MTPSIYKADGPKTAHRSYCKDLIHRVHFALQRPIHGLWLRQSGDRPATNLMPRKFTLRIMGSQNQWFGDPKEPCKKTHPNPSVLEGPVILRVMNFLFWEGYLFGLVKLSYWVVATQIFFNVHPETLGK